MSQRTLFLPLALTVMAYWAVVMWNVLAPASLCWLSDSELDNGLWFFFGAGAVGFINEFLASVKKRAP